VPRLFCTFLNVSLYVYHANDMRKSQVFPAMSDAASRAIGKVNGGMNSHILSDPVRGAGGAQCEVSTILDIGRVSWITETFTIDHDQWRRRDEDGSSVCCQLFVSVGSDCREEGDGWRGVGRMAVG